MRKKEETERSIHGDDTNVLVKKFKLFTVRGLVNKSAF